MPSDTDSESTQAPPLLHGLVKAELEAVCEAMKQPSFRARQIWRWAYVQVARDWAEMKNLPASFREQMAKGYRLDALRTLRVSGPEAATQKLLVELPDGERIEEVLIPAGERRTVCVSSQVGCRYRCAFCASGKGGFKRNLGAGEIVGQVVLAARAFGVRPSHVVFMGIGEPMDNYDAVLRSVRILNDAEGMNIGARRMTISTSGLVAGIKRLASEDLQVELSVSLHAANQKLRSELMPVAGKHPLPALIEACADYSAATKRIVTFEYTLINGVNDRPEDAAELARRLSPLPCRVNLIPLSPVPEFDGLPSVKHTADMFIQALKHAGINATLRTSKGGPVNAACGQLRASTAP